MNARHWHEVMQCQHTRKSKDLRTLTTDRRRERWCRRSRERSVRQTVKISTIQQKGERAVGMEVPWDPANRP